LLSFVRILGFPLSFVIWEGSKIFYLFSFYFEGGSYLALLNISLKTPSNLFWFRHSYKKSFLTFTGALSLYK
jgi:hypothetical protein